MSPVRRSLRLQGLPPDGSFAPGLTGPPQGRRKAAARKSASDRRKKAEEVKIAGRNEAQLAELLVRVDIKERSASGDRNWLAVVKRLDPLVAAGRRREWVSSVLRIERDARYLAPEIFAAGAFDRLCSAMPTAFPPDDPNRDRSIRIFNDKEETAAPRPQGDCQILTRLPGRLTDSRVPAELAAVFGKHPGLRVANWSSVRVFADGDGDTIHINETWTGVRHTISGADFGLLWTHLLEPNLGSCTPISD
jgi:hypothetical protein